MELNLKKYDEIIETLNTEYKKQKSGKVIVKYVSKIFKDYWENFDPENEPRLNEIINFKLGLFDLYFKEVLYKSRRTKIISYILTNCNCFDFKGIEADSALLNEMYRTPLCVSIWFNYSEPGYNRLYKEILGTAEDVFNEEEASSKIYNSLDEIELMEKISDKQFVYNGFYTRKFKKILNEMSDEVAKSVNLFK